MGRHGTGKEGRKELVRMVEEDGWYLARISGGHWQYKHPTKRGLVTIPLKISKNIELSVKRQAGLKGEK
jgi:predicted RNA binding protein YcfA (HicA-like mRNA interferase family)